MTSLRVLAGSWRMTLGRWSRRPTMTTTSLRLKSPPAPSRKTRPTKRTRKARADTWFRRSFQFSTCGFLLFFLLRCCSIEYIKFFAQKKTTLYLLLDQVLALMAITFSFCQDFKFVIVFCCSMEYCSPVAFLLVLFVRNLFSSI